MDIGFDELKVGLDLLKAAIGLAKDTKDLLPESDNKNALTAGLESAERSTVLAEAQIAKSLGYQLCQCTFPPQIMLSVGRQGAQERFQCPTCKKVWPDPVPLNTSGRGGGGNSWMGR
jgi:hypothetical protein